MVASVGVEGVGVDDGDGDKNERDIEKERGLELGTHFWPQEDGYQGRKESEMGGRILEAGIYEYEGEREWLVRTARPRSAVLVPQCFDIAEQARSPPRPNIPSFVSLAPRRPVSASIHSLAPSILIVASLHYNSLATASS